MGDYITITPSTGTWVVRAGGAVLGESDNALILKEGDYAPVTYFPREAIAMEFLDESVKTTTCPHKGEASYFSIVTKSTTLKDAVWSYETPKEGVEAIAGHLAVFVGDTVTVSACSASTRIGVARTAARMRSAMRSDCSSVVSGSSTTNSSPP